MILRPRMFIRTKQLTFPHAIAHEDVTAEVVTLGKAEGYNAFLGPIYSECERCVVSCVHAKICSTCARVQVRMGSVLRIYSGDARGGDTGAHAAQSTGCIQIIVRAAESTAGAGGAANGCSAGGWCQCATTCS